MTKRNKLSWKIGGEAGFGIKSAGIMFARIFMKGGYEIFDYTEYPSLIRGGHNTYQLIVDTKPVNSVTRSIDILVALNQEGVNAHWSELEDGAIMIYDSDKAVFSKAKSNKHKVEGLGVPMSKLAKEAGAELMRNVVGIGATLALVDQKLTVANQIVKEQFQHKGEKIVSGNIKALKLGYDYVKKHYKGECPCVLPSRKTDEDNILITANESVALGALAGGLNFFVAYPMTPSSSILHYLAAVSEKVGIVVKHAEDEISVINMALGGAHAGARAMVATSGGGFALMTESLGLAGLTETGIVMVNVQRPGPATGLPTWQEQGDLQFMLRAAQGDFPRIIIAPGDANEAFYLAAEAMNLAEVYQTPVIILSDKLIGEGNSTLPKFDTAGLKINRGKLLSEQGLRKLGTYNRYKVTNDGISPRTIPGMKGGLYIANSDEHNPYGHSEEGAENRIAQVDKRQRKLDTFAERMPAPLVYGNHKAKKTVVVWGSTKGVVLDAYHELSPSQKKKIKIMQLQYLWPFPSAAMKHALQNSKDVMLIENNSNAQLGQLIAQETGVLIKNKMLKYDGRPFFREEVLAALRKF